DPPDQKIPDAVRRLVRPKPIELLAEDIRFEQPPVCREQCLELRALRSADRLPAAEQQPPFPASVLPHHRASAKGLLTPHLVERTTFLREIDFGIALRGFETDVPEPAANQIELNAGLEEGDGTGVAKRVRVHAFPRE